MNVTPVTAQTNIEWGDKNPTDQVEASKSYVGSDSELKSVWAKHFVDRPTLGVLTTEAKNRGTFYEFLEARQEAFVEVLKTWGFPDRTNASSDQEQEEF